MSRVTDRQGTKSNRRFFRAVARERRRLRQLSRLAASPYLRRSATPSNQERMARLSLKSIKEIS